MAHAPGGFIAARKAGTTSKGMGAIPIPISAVVDDCPLGFRRIFGTCQLDVPSYAGLYYAPIILSGRTPRK